MVLDPVGSVPGPDTTSETVSGSGYDSSEKTDLHPTLEELPDPQHCFKDSRSQKYYTNLHQSLHMQNILKYINKNNKLSRNNA